MALTISTSNSVNLTGNPVYVSMSGGTIPVGASAYKYMLKIESTDDKLTGAPFTDAIAPDGDMEAEFNIQGYIDQPVVNVFEWPVVNTAILRTNPTFEIELRAGERYIDSNGDLVENWDAGTTAITGFKGGVSQRQLDIWGIANSFESVYLAADKFLTQRPQDDICHPHQPVKLWWFQTIGDSVDTMKLVCTYTDGTSVTADIAITCTDAGLYELNVNPYHNSVDMESGGFPLRNWTVALYDGETKVTDTRRFQYNLAYCERPFWLFFANSLGGIDDIYLSGYAAEGFATEGTMVYKPPTRSNTVYDRTQLMPNKQGRNKWRINTGFKSATQMLHLRDMLLSREAWLLYPNNGVTNYYVIPVNITSSDETLVDRAADLWAIDINMEEAHSSQYSFDNRLY